MYYSLYDGTRRGSGDKLHHTDYHAKCSQSTVKNYVHQLKEKKICHLCKGNIYKLKTTLQKNRNILFTVCFLDPTILEFFKITFSSDELFYNFNFKQEHNYYESILIGL